MGDIGPSRCRYDVLPTERDQHWEREVTALLTAARPDPPSRDERRTTTAERRRG